MKRWKIQYRHLAVLAVLLAVAGRAEDLTTMDGKVYHEVTVTGSDADGIQISHSAGAKNLPFSLLPPEWRARYGTPEPAAPMRAPAVPPPALQVQPPARPPATAVAAAGFIPQAAPPRPLVFQMDQLEEARQAARREAKVIAWIAGDPTFLPDHPESKSSDGAAAFRHYGSLLQHKTVLVYSQYNTYRFHEYPKLNEYVHTKMGSPIMLPTVVFLDENFDLVLGHLPYYRHATERESNTETQLARARQAAAALKASRQPVK